LFSELLSDGRVKCTLCPIKCKIPQNKTGKCHIRQNVDGKIHLNNYGMTVQTSLDTLYNRPIYLLGEDRTSLSIGLTGCNNTCPFCQNWLVSQAKDFSGSVYLSPEDVIEYAKENEVEFISFTYTEPIVWIEYVLEIAKLARENNIKICIKTAGYISEEHFDIFTDSIDAINLDIKPLSKDYLIKCGIYDQEIIWKLAKNIVEKGIHLEISHIVITGVNDNEEKMQLFLEGMFSLGREIPIHLLKHYPAWKSDYSTTPDVTMVFWRDYLISKSHKNIFAKEVG